LCRNVTGCSTSYFQDDPSQPGDRTSFWVNSIDQIPNLPSVVSNALENRLWLIGLIVVLEFGALILWIVMKKFEREVWTK
jgi:hypothetical protein